MGHTLDEFCRLAELPLSALVSEEDVKNKVVLPLFRALGYVDEDFNYERRTGRGYVDIVVEHYPTAVVIEAKAPKTKLNQYMSQLEGYVFQKHTEDRTTMAILTDGESFRMYGVKGPLYRGNLGTHSLMSFRRSGLGSSAVIEHITNLLGKQANQDGAVAENISHFRQTINNRIKAVETHLSELEAERGRIDTQISELNAERDALFELTGVVPATSPKSAGAANGQENFEAAKDGRKMKQCPAIPDILRILDERGARSRLTAVDRRHLDDALINKVNGVNNDTAVSFALIELRRVGIADYEKLGGKIGPVWLK